VNKLLIVTADDVGLHPAMTAGAIRAHRQGIVTACSVVANGAALADAVEQLASAPDISVGIHLTLVEERPLSDPASVPTLIGADGRFHRSFAAFVPRFAAGLIRIDQVEKELRAQVERLLRDGLRLEHANGHQHLHMLPAIFERVLALCHEYGIRYVRTVDDAGGAGAPVIRRASIAILTALGRRARTTVRDVRTNDRTIGVTDAGHLDESALIRLLDHVDGLTELVCHPADFGSSPGPGEAYNWGYDWQRETDALCSTAVREALATRGIALTSPRELQHTSS